MNLLIRGGRSNDTKKLCLMIDFDVDINKFATKASFFSPILLGLFILPLPQHSNMGMDTLRLEPKSQKFFIKIDM